MKTAQELIDEIIGSGQSARDMTLGDRERLDYLERLKNLSVTFDPAMEPNDRWRVDEMDRSGLYPLAEVARGASLRGAIDAAIRGEDE